MTRILQAMAGAPVGGAERQAEHYKLTGDLARELWYDGDGVLRRVRFQAEDESTIEYVLQ